MRVWAVGVGVGVGVGWGGGVGWSRQPGFNM